MAPPVMISALPSPLRSAVLTLKPPLKPG